MEFERFFSRNRTAEVTLTQRQAQRAEDRRRDIYDSHRHRTFGIAYYMTGNEIEAENILSGTFIKAFTAVEEPSGKDVDTALLSELKERFALHEEVKPITHDTAGTVNVSGRNVRRTDMEEAVQTLPPSERLLFLLHDVEGYKPPAIAQLLQMTEQQVNRSLISARIRMRRALAEVQRTRDKAA